MPENGRQPSRATTNRPVGFKERGNQVTESRTIFQTNPKSLAELLRDVRSGKIQLPDFQRSWVWDDERIRGLLASISLNYPIGVLMMLQTGDEDVRFKHRPLEGAPTPTTDPEFLILDGQQRLTALFLSLFQDGPVKTRDAQNKPVKRRYYFDIRKALDEDADREDAVVSISAERVVKNFRGEVVADYSDQEKECVAELIPVPLLLDTNRLYEWQRLYWTCIPDKHQERFDRWIRFSKEIVEQFQGYQVPVITMLKGTPKEAVCQVFEKVNTGGVPLTVFELLTATYAAEGFELRKDWDERYAKFKARNVTRAVGNTDFLMTVSLLATKSAGRAVSCRRRDILDLSLEEYRRAAAEAEAGYERAARFLINQGILSAHDIPYKTQLIPLAAILATLGDSWESDSARQKLARWFWCGVFGEMYGGSVEARFAKDLVEVVAWIRGEANSPSTVQEAQFFESRLLRLRTRNSAPYKGIYNLLIKEGGLDFRTGEPIRDGTYFNERYDVHHIFPEDWCRSRGIEPRVYNSILNKTVVSARTNRSIGGKAPSDYLERIQRAQGMSDERMDEILRTHLIEPECLRSDDFDRFLELRRQALASRVEAAIGKQVQRDLARSLEAYRAADDSDAEWDYDVVEEDVVA
ncbi:MAG: DUF262 domain-containing protein [Fimbriimonadales bacterium]|nr:DUF262 domain-containing protein [Fimbriimonadales bacterium]